MPPPDRELEDRISGLDALETPSTTARSRLARFVSAAWPRAAAIVIAGGLWQIVAWSGWRPDYVLPGPATVLSQLGSDIAGGELLKATAVTMGRALIGFALALLIGSAVGMAVSKFRTLRAAVGSLLTGLQTMPSIAWFPLAILLFQLSESAILFVVVLGAAPAIANGLISGIDHIPPLLLRTGRILGARGFTAYRHVVLPAALPSYVGGLKQGWAFAWRSLMAGELLVIIANRPSLGVRLQFARELSDAPALMSIMLVILAIGIAVDTLVFGAADRAIRARRGLIE